MVLLALLGCPSAPPADPAAVPPTDPGPTPPAVAPAEPVPEDEACAVRVYVGPAVGPTELFAAPGGDLRGAFPVLEPLDGGISAGPILAISRSHDDGAWLEVASVEDYTLEEGAPARGPTQGWVRRSGLEVDLAMSAVSPQLVTPHPVHLFAGPDPDASIVHTYHQEAHRAEVLDCRGGWLQVRVTLDADGSSAEGWLAPGTHCGHPFTTCG